MPSIEIIRRQAEAVLTQLIAIGLAGDYNGIIRRSLSVSHSELTFPGSTHLSLALKDKAYLEIYESLAAERAYCALLPDGAMIQMSYVFNEGNLERHRLAFFPSPHLEDFQRDPSIYMEEEMYSDVVGRNVVPFPIRFDFDCREGIWKELEHPQSHMTLGQYEECRIPVSAPITPYRFVDFILRNFYQSAFIEYSKGFAVMRDEFDDCVQKLEEEVVHVRIPRAKA